MAILHFDEPMLRTQLERLPRERRAAFAAACAERLLPAYRRFSQQAGRGEPEMLRRALTRLWDDLTGNPLSEEELRSTAKGCLALVPREDDEPWVEWQPSAEDAAASLVYALESRLTEGSQEAAWAARRAYDALDRFVMSGEQGLIVTAGAEERVLAHPLVQAELQRQRLDLDDLLGADDGHVQAVVARLRVRAVAEGESLFAMLS